MTVLRKAVRSSSLRGVAAWAPTTDLVHIDQIVRIALDDRGAPPANWRTGSTAKRPIMRALTRRECSTTGHYDPSAGTLDALAWHVSASKAPLSVRLTMMAILAGALAVFGGLTSGARSVGVGPKLRERGHGTVDSATGKIHRKVQPLRNGMTRACASSASSTLSQRIRDRYDRHAAPKLKPPCRQFLSGRNHGAHRREAPADRHRQARVHRHSDHLRIQRSFAVGRFARGADRQVDRLSD